MTHREYSVIVRCYNEERHIGKLLSGIAAQEHPPREIIVVDSGSIDATVSIAERFATTIIRVSQGMFSFGHALNVGCRSASTPFLLFTSAHVYPLYTSWSRILLEPFEESAVGIVYGKQRGNTDARFSERRIFERWYPEHSDVAQLHPFCNNANAAIRRSLWEQIPFDDTLPGLEDLDWAKKITRRGSGIVYRADAPVIHVHEETLRAIFNRYYREAYALKRISPEERFGKATFLKLLAENILADSRAALKQRVFFRQASDIVLFRLMQFFGTYRGFHNGQELTSALRDRFYHPRAEGGSLETPVPSAEKIQY